MLCERVLCAGGATTSMHARTLIVAQRGIAAQGAHAHMHSMQNTRSGVHISTATPEAATGSAAVGEAMEAGEERAGWGWVDEERAGWGWAAAGKEG